MKHKCPYCSLPRTRKRNKTCGALACRKRHAVMTNTATRGLNWHVNDDDDCPDVIGRSIAPPAKRYERVLYWPDTHCGDQDDRAIELALKVVKYIKPDKIVQLGDFVDFNGLSSFEAGSFSPSMKLQRELDIAHDLLGRITEVTPHLDSSSRTMLEGNHEARLYKWLKKQPAFQQLRVLELHQLLKLGELGWEPSVYKSMSLSNGSFLARHGDKIRQDAGQSAKQELFSSLTSGISGHTHRQAQFFFRAHAGLLSWTEAGHLQNNPPAWKQDVQNWQQGLVIGEHEINGNAYHITMVPFRTSYRTTVDGKEIG